MILVVSDRPWVAAAYTAWSPRFETALVTSRDKLVGGDHSHVDMMAFPHWSWRVPAAIHERIPCIGFHPGDLPRGRGGTPIQNLIARGIYATTLCAFKMTDQMDAGPVYLREPADLGVGSAGVIYYALSRLALRMVERIVHGGIVPQPQTGEPTYWRRRTPEESTIPSGLTPRQLYDFIRMLDAPGYPRAFTETGGHRVTFTNAQMMGNRVTANATFGGTHE